MSVINRQQFHEQYGLGHAIEPMLDPRQTGQDIITALCDHFKPRRVLEIGINTGETAKAILSNAPYIKEYIGVDLPDMWFKAKSESKPGQDVFDDRLTILTPKGGSKGIKPGDIEPVDFIFVDGDHTYAGIELDTRLAYSLLNPGGVIVWHDYGRMSDIDVTAHIHYLNLKEREGRIVHVAGTWIAYEITPGAPEAVAEVLAIELEPMPVKKARKKVKPEAETL